MSKPISTDSQLAALKLESGQKERFIPIKGKERLFVRLRPIKNGFSKTWVYRYTFAAKQRKYIIGDYPDIGLAGVGDIWQELNSLVAQGVDLNEHKKQKAKQQKRESENKFSLVCDKWADTQNWSANTTIRRQRDLEIFKAWFADTPISQISTDDIIELLKDIEDKYRQRDNPELPSDKASRCRGRLISLFSWATLHGYCKTNPAEPIANAKSSHVLKQVKYGHRPALVKPDEFSRLLADIFKDTTMQPDTRHNMLLLAYTGVRNGDIREMKWADIDLEAGKWELTPKKSGSSSDIRMIEKMTVPLSRQVIAILQERQKFTGGKKYVFAKDNQTGLISENATNTALKRMGYQDRHCSHGFRAAAKTILMSELDYNDMITEMVLGHKVKGGDNPYLRGDLYKRRCELMQTWADYIDDLAAGKDTAKYKGIYRENPAEVFKVLLQMLGRDELIRLLS
ncbi:hypothetical protein B0181_03295 [Moraxella caviae]|uniref:Prophage CP4-57 integrase n=1 Tax=Moraxella caviae TaxID=34060 RepID=A0A1T0A7P5_9GAMM|nr:site-specific integrase [Moraxella caviae]OOR91341.1 hypothetical protein B0181_03295 [Moraxella caviae]STZ13951.1 Prophage CP4-57 integrase [Moraxella caviae]VEW13008.1 Prophage CP4-57 integrase [Moraxella caviae]